MLYDKLLIQFGYVNDFITILIKCRIKSIKSNRFPLYRGEKNRFNVLADNGT